MKRKKRSNPTLTTIRPVSTNNVTSTQFRASFKLRNLSKLAWASIAGGGVILILFIIYFVTILQDLPPLTKLERIEPAQATQVFSADGELITVFFTSNRTYTPFEKIPKSVSEALISMEDRDFYKHWGINLYGIVRALFVDIIHLSIRQGASTLTMQLARNLYFGQQQTWTRKIKEALTAIQIERTYSKNEILEMYLNVNDFGNNSFGIEAAARRYFNKKVEDLKVEEAALLIGILKGTTYYSPIRHPDRAKHQRNVVLSTMVENGKLSKAKFDSLKDLPLNLDLNDPNETKMAPYFAEHVRRQLRQLQDSLGVNIYEDGLRVYTTLNTKFQHFMEKAIANHMDDIQKRVRSQGALQRMRKTMGDSAWKDLTTVQLAFVALNPHNGQILAMVGGRDFKKSKFNRVIQAKRQPGSAFKPIVYTTAIDNGSSPTDEYLNQPTPEINPDGSRWTPENYDKSVGGLTTLREALMKSINLVAIRLIDDINPRLVVHYGHEMGLTTDLRPYSSLALGSSEVIPLELVSAYGIFATNGLYYKPYSIEKIEDRNGNLIYQHTAQSHEALSPETVTIMRSMLEDVVNKGTGYHVRSIYHLNYNIPAGGKTGTTNDFTDAWFVGFTPDIAAGVWVGLDDPKLSLGHGMSGSVAALPFWGDFVSSIYDSVQFIHSHFEDSPNVFKLEICMDSKKLAGPYCPHTVKDLFTERTRPTEVCDIHGGYDSVRGKRRHSF